MYISDVFCDLCRFEIVGAVYWIQDYMVCRDCKYEEDRYMQWLPDLEDGEEISKIAEER